MRTRVTREVNDAFSPDFLDFIVCLNERRVKYVLVGGYALGVHGVIRATGDIDFLYRRTTANVLRLCSALEDFGAPLSVIDANLLMTPELVIQFGQPPYRIDLLSAIDGVNFDQVWSGAMTTTIAAQKMRVIGLAELRVNKASTGRKKDADDLRRLNAARPRKRRKAN